MFACVSDNSNSNDYFISFGSATTNQGPHLGMVTSGTLRFGNWGGSTIDVSVSFSHPTLMWVVGTYDGTNGRLYLNGELIGGPTAFTFNGSNGTARFGVINREDFGWWAGYFVHGGFANVAWSPAQAQHFFNPATRWDLYRELERVTYFVPVVAGANPKGPFGMPFHGPFGGPVG